MTLRIISGVMAAISCRIASFRASKVTRAMFVNLCFEVAPEKKIARGQIWRTRRPSVITTEGDNMSRKPAIFFINSSTIKARCSPNHAMVYTENGTYTAVRRRTPHHCTRSPFEDMPLPNRGVLSAATFIMYLLFYFAPTCFGAAAIFRELTPILLNFYTDHACTIRRF